MHAVRDSSLRSSISRRRHSTDLLWRRSSSFIVSDSPDPLQLPPRSHSLPPHQQPSPPPPPSATSPPPSAAAPRARPCGIAAVNEHGNKSSRRQRGAARRRPTGFWRVFCRLSALRTTGPTDGDLHTATAAAAEAGRPVIRHSIIVGRPLGRRARRIGCCELQIRHCRRGCRRTVDGDVSSYG